ncbi:MAG: META domain-containing protein [Gammaproteobacteria bacterium]|jgi:heat shock protein HslJ|nr:META domain-containing protein [Gammaproteobacteria bacterium]MDH5176813.1 META domain-containing protein [Gammaproteobacteria bacterium]MDH5227683.1 META domain-containing protein [Gammaproteobacteria bacterium]
MNLRWIGAPGAAVLFFLLAGCSGVAATQEPASWLEGTAWVLDELPGHVLTAPGNVTLQFGGGRASGSDGCNRFAGGFQADAKALQFSQLAGTQMACEPEVMAQAGAVTGALMATRAYRDAGRRLELLGADGKTVAVYKAQELQVEGTAWEVTGINNGKGGVASLVADTNVTLQFGPESRASGTAGCNRYTAGYTADKGALTFAPAAATRMMCAASGVMEQEQAFLQALTRVATVRMEGDRLELRAADGALMVSARRAAPAP